MAPLWVVLLAKNESSDNISACNVAHDWKYYGRNERAEDPAAKAPTRVREERRGYTDLIRVARIMALKCVHHNGRKSYEIYTPGSPGCHWHAVIH